MTKFPHGIYTKTVNPLWVLSTGFSAHPILTYLSSVVVPSDKVPYGQANHKHLKSFVHTAIFPIQGQKLIQDELPSTKSLSLFNR
jgi:hypothetical protein